MTRRNRKNSGVIIIVATLLLVISIMDIVMVFRNTRQQTKDSGIYQLETISGELESTINDAENLTMELAIASREYLGNKEQLGNFIYTKKAELLSDDNGVFNVFISGKDWDIIPDFDVPEGFVATDRVWYKGAIKNNGKTYVTAPYQDAMTGNICYTVSVMLGDGQTVLGIDYTMENIQGHITQMYESGSRNAVIITDEGIIAGCANEALIGEKLINALPDYVGIWSLSKTTDGVATARIKADYLYDNLFATKSGNGWYLIVSEGDWHLYRHSYIQLLATALLSIVLFVVIIILYTFMVKSQKNLEGALASKEEFLNDITGELREPLAKILDSSSKENAEHIVDYAEEMSRIHVAGERLSEMIGQIISYSSIVQTENKEKRKEKTVKTMGMNKRFRTVILLFMVVVMLISLYTNVSSSLKWGDELLQSEAEKYEFQLSEWINTQKSILDMFVSVISTHPELLEDYEATVEFLNQITVQYPEISVTYMTNPILKHTVYMNNGWEPDADWHVEERQWYIDTLASESGWSISAPYFDEQTGGYCVTISERVYDAKTGDFLGIFGIDFFMDKLVQILGDSYSNTGYAFLVDTEGDIINHPYGSYQMSQEGKTNISELPYGKIKADGVSTTIFKDYDNSYKMLIAARNDMSYFMVYVVVDIWTIYGRVFLYGLICVVTFLTCIILVYRLLTNMIRWQDETNLQMKEAADAAIAAGKAKSQFLAQMSHEIRTPINAVLGMNEMILREASDEDILEYAANIREAGKTLLSLINSILDFSKIEDGKMEIIPVKYDVASIINNLVNSIADRANDKSLELIINVDENIPSYLFGDDVRITQVIMNLLTNAVKYTEKGTVTLSIKVGDRDGDFVYLDVMVKDTGIGIKKEDIEKLFQVFERLDEKRNAKVQGTGLGLNITKQLLFLMGSQIEVTSDYGNGSTFSFVLRQKIIDEKPIGKFDMTRKNKKSYVSYTPSFYAPDAKILIIDDNAMNLTVFTGLLKSTQIQMDTGESGDACLNMIKKNTYDMIFLDHMMPGMDGIETFKKMQTEEHLCKDVPVIILTANAVLGAKEMYIEKGFTDYLSKPVSGKALEEMIVKYLPKELIQEEALDKDVKEPEIDISEINEEPSAEQSETEASEINRDTGLSYCGGMDELYNEMLGMFLADGPDKIYQIEQCYDDKDYPNYAVYVHALKSTALSIGAESLSADAKELELAAKAGNEQLILEKHSLLIEHYENVLKEIQHKLN